ncbi:MAG: FAD-dependent monooxygenase [Casimicrobiaceae bacterium]
MSKLHDVIIVGAGPVGASLAIALADADLDVAIVDARSAQGSPRGERSLALSHGARLVFERLGIWGGLVARDASVTPIVEIDVSQTGGFGQARLAAADHDLPALGYVVGYGALQGALADALRLTRTSQYYGYSVTLAGGTRAYAAVTGGAGVEPLLGKLVVVADGSGANVAGVIRRRHDYRQSALVAKIGCRASHRGIAYERFTPEGPIALLPEGDHYGLVWTATPELVAARLALPDDAFLDRLSAHFGRRRADFVSVADRRSFPLALEYAPSVTAPRTVLIGNAAQALHPVAGQGFNLGVRDAFELARVLVDTAPEAIGSPAMLARYARLRRTDRVAGVAFTHGLLGVFMHPAGWISGPRGLALSLLDATPGLKRTFTRAVLFGLR